jgi:hypothetical protein
LTRRGAFQWAVYGTLSDLVDSEFDLVYLTEVEIPSWPAAECRLCHEGVPVNTKYAHGADFVAAQG